MPFTLFLIMGQLLAAQLCGCGRPQDGGWYGFDVGSAAGVNEVTVRFSDGSVWPIGHAGWSKSVNDLPGPIPQAADVSWTDNGGLKHHQHVSLVPLPPPTKNSFNDPERKIYFIIQPDNTVQLMGHNPLLEHP